LNARVAELGKQLDKLAVQTGRSRAANSSPEVLNGMPYPTIRVCHCSGEARRLHRRAENQETAHELLTEQYELKARS
jgi:hypothetical protein